MNKSFKIGGRGIGEEFPPFIIAEMSGNHNKSYEHALAIVEAAAQAGVSALKLQTYTADTMTIDLNEREFHIGDPGSLWAGKSLYQLYEEANTPWEWHAPLFKRCAELGMAAFSTPFDATAVDFLESLNVNAELQKLLTSLSFEVKTEIRFIPNDESTGGVKANIKRQVAVKKRDGEKE